MSITVQLRSRGLLRGRGAILFWVASLIYTTLWDWNRTCRERRDEHISFLSVSKYGRGIQTNNAWRLRFTGGDGLEQVEQKDG